MLCLPARLAYTSCTKLPAEWPPPMQEISLSRPCLVDHLLPPSAYALQQSNPTDPLLIFCPLLSSCHVLVCHTSGPGQLRKLALSPLATGKLCSVPPTISLSSETLPALRPPSCWPPLSWTGFDLVLNPLSSLILWTEYVLLKFICWNVIILGERALGGD